MYSKLPEFLLENQVSSNSEKYPMKSTKQPNFKH